MACVKCGYTSSRGDKVVSRLSHERESIIVLSRKSRKIRTPSQDKKPIVQSAVIASLLLAGPDEGRRRVVHAVLSDAPTAGQPGERIARPNVRKLFSGNNRQKGSTVKAPLFKATMNDARLFANLIGAISSLIEEADSTQTRKHQNSALWTHPTSPWSTLNGLRPPSTVTSAPVRQNYA